MDSVICAWAKGRRILGLKLGLFYGYSRVKARDILGLKMGVF